MQNRSFKGRPPKQEHSQESRIRVNIHSSLKGRIQRRLDEEGMTLSAYLQHLIRMDTGAYV